MPRAMARALADEGWEQSAVAWPAQFHAQKQSARGSERAWSLVAAEQCAEVEQAVK
jgi:hypothetical protein